MNGVEKKKVQDPEPKVIVPSEKGTAWYRLVKPCERRAGLTY
jgi:hypothetical protein